MVMVNHSNGISKSKQRFVRQWYIEDKYFSNTPQNLCKYSSDVWRNVVTKLLPWHMHATTKTWINQSPQTKHKLVNALND
jgi:hypothetical protein